MKYIFIIIPIFFFVLIGIALRNSNLSEKWFLKSASGKRFIENVATNAVTENQKKYWSVKDKDETIETMSILLNEAMDRIGQLSCEISKIDTSQNKSWCSKINGNNSSQNLTDEYLARYMSKFLKGKTVASFGDGPGIYKEILLSLKEVESYDAYDGAPFAESTTDNRVKFLDLSVPIYHLKKYDWVVSLEVAEHIPAKYESVYLDNLVRHAKEGIILSMSKIGQGVYSNINEREFPYVKEQIEARGFTHDPVSSEKFRNISIVSCFRSNLNVFRNKNIST